MTGLRTDGLTRWLQAAHPELWAGADLRSELITGGRSNLTYAVDGARVPLVLRRPPLGHVLSSAHDMRREHRVISALAETTVPVPRAIDVVDDAEAAAVTGTVYFVMERAPGRVLAHRGDNTGFEPARLHRLGLDLVGHLADLHAVAPADVGLERFGRPEGFLERQLATWRRQLAASRTRETPLLDRLQDALSEDVPGAARAGIVHGDFRLDNALVVTAPDGAPHVSAILDWEMATLGDPLVDLGMLSVYWRIAEIAGDADILPSAVDETAGYPSFDELADEYARRAGIARPDLRWYRAFAAFKLAVILEGIHFRYLAGETLGDGFSRLGSMVETLAEHGLLARESRKE